MNAQARAFARDWKHRWYGFWALEGEATGHAFSLDSHVDPAWAPKDLSSLVNYLKSCPIALAGQQPPARCGFCDELLHVSAYRSDGTLLWADPVAHLVEKHGFVLPDSWVEHIRRLNYVPSAKLSLPADKLPWPSTP